MRVPRRVEICKVRPHPRTTSLAACLRVQECHQSNINFEGFSARKCGNSYFRGASRVLRYADPKDWLDSGGRLCISAGLDPEYRLSSE